MSTSFITQLDRGQGSYPLDGCNGLQTGPSLSLCPLDSPMSTVWPIIFLKCASDVYLEHPQTPEGFLSLKIAPRLLTRALGPCCDPGCPSSDNSHTAPSSACRLTCKTFHKSQLQRGLQGPPTTAAHGPRVTLTTSPPPPHGSYHDQNASFSFNDNTWQSRPPSSLYPGAVRGTDNTHDEGMNESEKE